MAAGPLGPLPGRSGGDAPGAERTGGGLRVADRGVGLDYPERPSDGRLVGGVRGVRAGDPAGARQGWDRPGTPAGQAAWTSPNGLALIRAGPSAAARTSQPVGD